MAERDAWYVTTAGWPWVARLTTGGVAVAPLRWRRLSMRTGPHRDAAAREAG